MKQNKRQLQKENTRNLILKTAYQVYSDLGFGATTNMIAKEAKISHGSVFLHFPSVEDLQVCLLEQFGSEISNQLHELSEQNNTLEQILYAHLDILIKHEKFYGRLISDSSRLPLQSQYVYISIQSAVSIHLNQVIEKNQKEGLIKTLPMHFIFNSWIGLIHYYLMNQRLFAPEGSVLSRYKEELVYNFVKLLSTKGVENESI
jgi:AcrR family transcriptional regulator